MSAEPVRLSDPGSDDPEPKAGVGDLHAGAECAAILAHMQEFLDHELSEASADAIRAHLDACEQCLDDYDVVFALKHLVNRCCRTAKAPQQLRVTIMTSITRWRAS